MTSKHWDARYDGNNLRNDPERGWTAMDGGRRIHEQELLAYRYPDPEEFDAAGLQIVYLGWFLGDWSLVNNGMIPQPGSHTRRHT